MPPHRPTILQIIPDLDTGGAERTTIEMTQAIAAAGGRALVVANGGRLVPEVTRAGGAFVAMPVGSKNPGRMLLTADRLRRLVQAEAVDLLHARSRAPAWVALLAARATGRPFVTTYHGAYSEPNALKRIYNSVMAQGDIVIANSRYTADLIRARYGTSETRLRVIHRGLDPGFDPALVGRERIERLRSSWGVQPEQRVILHAARLTGWKGQAIVVSAAGLLRERAELGNWVVVLAGDAQGRTDYVEGLRRQIADLGLTGRVRIPGHVADMPAAYCAAHVAVVASTEPEAFGRSAAEAEAMRCPVIATCIGAAPETVWAPPAASTSDMTGWLVSPGDPAALASRLAEVLTMSDPERAALGARARAFVIQRFTLEAMQRATLRVYDTLLGTHLAG